MEKCFFLFEDTKFLTKLGENLSIRVPGYSRVSTEKASSIQIFQNRVVWNHYLELVHSSEIRLFTIKYKFLKLSFCVMCFSGEKLSRAIEEIRHF